MSKTALRKRHTPYSRPRKQQKAGIKSELVELERLEAEVENKKAKREKPQATKEDRRQWTAKEKETRVGIKKLVQRPSEEQPWGISNPCYSCKRAGVPCVPLPNRPNITRCSYCVRIKKKCQVTESPPGATRPKRKAKVEAKPSCQAKQVHLREAEDEDNEGGSDNTALLKVGLAIVADLKEIGQELRGVRVAIEEFGRAVGMHGWGDLTEDAARGRVIVAEVAAKAAGARGRASKKAG